MAFVPSRCSNCSSDNCLRPHELRSREFWLVNDRLVIKTPSYVLRVTCKRCKVRSTITSDFALPYHNYLRAEVVERADAFISDPGSSYRSCVSHKSMGVHHRDGDQTLAHSTVHRWIRFIGSLAVLLRQGTKHLIEFDSTYSPTDLNTPISPQKYKSEGRRFLLSQARHFLSVRQKILRSGNFAEFPMTAPVSTWK